MRRLGRPYSLDGGQYVLVSTAGVGKTDPLCTCPPSGLRKSQADAPMATAIPLNINMIGFAILLFILGSPSTAA